MGSAGGVIAQPVLGRVADVNGYGASYVVAAGVQALALPFIVLARREHAVSDPITEERRRRCLTKRPIIGPRFWPSSRLPARPAPLR